MRSSKTHAVPALVSLLALAGCLHAPVAVQRAPQESAAVEVRHVTPPDLSAAHLGERIVCVRPMRRGAPRMSVEREGGKVVAHDYGHGGSGDQKGGIGRVQRIANFEPGTALTNQPEYEDSDWQYERGGEYDHRKRDRCEPQRPAEREPEHTTRAFATHANTGFEHEHAHHQREQL